VERREAPLRATDGGLVPEGDGWFVVDARDAARKLGMNAGSAPGTSSTPPPGPRHVFVGAGEGPCLLLADGARSGRGVVYPGSALARRHRAGVENETSEPREAYAGHADDVPTRCRDEWLPTGIRRLRR
jgi:hypothetical protein